jgi:2-(3-amino-3-carboxypropyl)histidine synthase
LSTIQFNASIFKAKETLEMKGFTINIPQEKPRCAGETLGCTSPELSLDYTDTVIYLCDGRFHMEAVMIANPKHQFFQYNPYTKKMTIEKYDFPLMIKNRQEELARSKITPDTVVGVIMGVLGRQGSNYIVEVSPGLILENHQ